LLKFKNVSGQRPNLVKTFLNEDKINPFISYILNKRSKSKPLQY